MRLSFTKEYLNECFIYTNGKIFWKARPRSHFQSDRGWKIFNTSFSGREAGNSNKSNGRWEIRVDGTLTRRSHVVWFIHGNALIAGKVIDHINRNPLDDRIENLRIATYSENAANSRTPKDNTSGYKGVCWDKRDKKWRSRITVNGKNINLGYFLAAESAHAAYMIAAEEHFGEFSSKGD